MTAPQECDDMEQVRAAIDQLDDQLIALLARRVQYIERAAQLKPRLAIPADVPERVRQVLLRVEASAKAMQLPTDLALTIWRGIIEWSIAHETALMARSGPQGKCC